MTVDLLDAAASGMDAQRAALDVAARNVAAAEAAGPTANIYASDSAQPAWQSSAAPHGESPFNADTKYIRSERVSKER
jgi:flagellar basal body rod protein FlgC